MVYILIFVAIWFVLSGILVLFAAALSSQHSHQAVVRDRPQQTVVREPATKAGQRALKPAT